MMIDDDLHGRRFLHEFAEIAQLPPRTGVDDDMHVGAIQLGG